MSSLWGDFEHDPRSAGNADLRASDRDRDTVAGVLGTAYAEGRLTREEFDERSDQVAATRRLGDLPAIIADLVASTPAALGPTALRLEAERRYRSERREAFFQFLTPSVICWVIWAWVLVNGNGTPFPWPIFVSLGTGIRAARVLTDKEDRIVSIQRRLEKKQSKQLGSGA